MHHQLAYKLTTVTMTKLWQLHFSNGTRRMDHYVSVVLSHGSKNPSPVRLVERQWLLDNKNSYNVIEMRLHHFLQWLSLLVQYDLFLMVRNVVHLDFPNSEIHHGRVLQPIRLQPIHLQATHLQ